MNNLIKTTKNKISKLEEELDLLRKIVVLSETLEKVSVGKSRKSVRKRRKYDSEMRVERKIHKKRGDLVVDKTGNTSEGPLTFSEIREGGRIVLKR